MNVIICEKATVEDINEIASFLQTAEKQNLFLYSTSYKFDDRKKSKASFSSTALTNFYVQCAYEKLKNEEKPATYRFYRRPESG